MCRLQLEASPMRQLVGWNLCLHFLRGYSQRTQQPCEGTWSFQLYRGRSQSNEGNRQRKGEQCVVGEIQSSTGTYEATTGKPEPASTSCLDPSQIPRQSLAPRWRRPRRRKGRSWSRSPEETSSSFPRRTTATTPAATAAPTAAYCGPDSSESASSAFCCCSSRFVWRIWQSRTGTSTTARKQRWMGCVWRIKTAAAAAAARPVCAANTSAAAA